MAYTTINDPTQYFNTVLYTGNNVDDRSITGVGFQPDFLWVKNRSAANGHALVDTTRGATATLRSQATNAEETESNGIQAFESDGFQVGTSGLVNTSSNNYVAWNWLANGGTTSSNTDGTITSTVQANTTAGFSIVTYTGTGSSATVGHGLGKTPSVLIIKKRSSGGSQRGWAVWNKSISDTYADNLLRLDTTDAVGNNSVYWGGGNHTSTTIELNTSTLNNESTYDFVAYCFAEIKGFSKFGTYTGNGSSDGTFVYTGFKPSWIMVKRTDSTGDWHLVDNKRNGFNVDNDVLLANRSDAEFDVTQYDILSNGFKLRSTANSNNASGGTYIYMAFAESPFVSSDGVPTTAR